MTTKSNPKSSDRQAPQGDRHNHKNAGGAKGHHGKNDARHPAGHGQQGDHDGVPSKTCKPERRDHHEEEQERVHEAEHNGSGDAHHGHLSDGDHA